MDDSTKQLKPPADITFDEISVYGSEKWCAAVLGKTIHWFRKHRTKLEADGFPKVDLLIGHTLKADVYEFVEGRRKIRKAIEIQGHPTGQKRRGRW